MRCNLCGKIYVTDTKGATGTMSKHIKYRCQRKNSRDVGQQLLSKMEGFMFVRSAKFSAEKFCELLSMAIIKHDLPFSVC